MEIQLTTQDKAQWRELLQKYPVIHRVIDATSGSVPSGFDPKKPLSTEQTAMVLVYVNGWRDCIKFLKDDCTRMDASSAKSSFENMNDRSEESSW